MTLSWREHISQAVDRRFDEIVALRRHLHQHPEPSGEEFKTSLLLYQQLSDAGFNVRLGTEGRGVVADFPSNRNDATVAAEQAPRCLALRADIDALCIHDEKQVPYRSCREGVMHACGHDAHTAILMGAIRVLHEADQEGALPWPVNIRGIFQPAEETCLGAIEMIEAGAVEGVDAIIALHVEPMRPVGDIGVRLGVMTAHCDDVQILVHGRGGHAARPHEAADPIAAALQLITSLYLYIPRVTDSREAVVVTIGEIHGGNNHNVIPETVLLRGTLRTLQDDVRQQTMEHIRRIAVGVAQAGDTKIKVDFTAGPDSVNNDTALVDLLREVGKDLLGSDCVEEIALPSMGGEDFSYYLQHVPGAMFRLGSALRKHAVGLHAPTFDIDEEALRIGAKMLATTAVLWFDPTRS